jgi:hypothetical protein
MSATYRVESVSCGDDARESLVEIAAPLLLSGDEIEKILPEMMKKDPLLFLQADLKKRGEKDTASNLRYKHEKDKNNQVVENFQKLLGEYVGFNPEKPVVITSYPRSERYYSAKLNEDGTMHMNDSRGGSVDRVFSELMMRFLGKYDIRLDKYRESCKGARYNTYFADLLSFLMMYLSFKRPEMFEDKYMGLDVALNDLESIPEKNGKEWVPKVDFKYLYFKDMSEGEEGSIHFRVPKSGEIGRVYELMKKILEDGENKEKKGIRAWLLEYSFYERFSDYWFNDIDDALTIQMIFHCFNCGDLSFNENKVKEQLAEIIHVIF